MIALHRRGTRAQRARKVDFPLPPGAVRRYIARREAMGRDQLEEYGWSDEELERLPWPPTVNAYVLEPGGRERPLARRDLDSRTGFEFGYSGGGPTELAICILLDFFEVYEQAPDLPVNFYSFRETFIAPANHDAERLEIDGSALVAWMDAERRREIRLARRRRHVRWSLRRRHRPGRR